MKAKSHPPIEEEDPADREYDFSGGVRGKYAHLFRDALMVRIEPDVAQVFPDADAVNAALREVIRKSREIGKTNTR